MSRALTLHLDEEDVRILESLVGRGDEPERVPGAGRLRDRVAYARDATARCVHLPSRDPCDHVETSEHPSCPWCIVRELSARLELLRIALGYHLTWRKSEGRWTFELPKPRERHKLGIVLVTAKVLPEETTE